ncbi:hypothetical protein KAR91_70435 [Candidatus Pacearchaeota archaeon]|nr:hypothetical protein [Candidatus Pacearchaeota archaeon]
MTQILNGKYILTLDELTSIALDGWLAFQPDGVLKQAYRISLENFIKALPIIPAVAGEYDNIADMLTAQPGQTVDVFYKVADPSDDPDYNDLKDSEIKSVYYHLVEEKTASLSDYNSIAIPKLESSKFPKLGNSLEALTFDVKFRSAEWSSNQATLQAIANALKVSSPQDLLLDALSVKLNTDNNPTDISRVLFGIDGQLIFEPIDSSKIQSDSDVGDVTLNDSYQLLLTITGNQNIANGLANIGLTAKSFSTAAITAFAASGNNRVRATSASHGFSEGDYVEIVNTANYNDIVEIKAVPNVNEFDFTAVFVATETGDWEKSENREIAVDLRVDAVSQKVFTRQIEGEGRLNFSEPLSGVVSGDDIGVYVKSNTVGEAIEILGTTQSSELKAISSDKNEPNTWYVNTNGDDAKDGSAEFPFEGIQKAHDTMAEHDIIIIQDTSFQQPLTPAITITKSITIKGVVSNTDKQPRLRGTWNLSVDIFFENVSLIEVTIVGAATIGVDTINCLINDLVTPATRNLIVEQWNCLMFNSSAINLRSIESHNSFIVSDINVGRTIDYYNVKHEGDLVAGIDAAVTSIMTNSFVDGNITITGGLEKNNSVITGTETVSGTTTSRQAKVFDDNVLFKGQATVSGVTISFTATPTFDFNTKPGGNNQQMPVEGNVTTFATSNELNAGNYDVWLVNDGTPGRTVAAPTGWPDEIPGGDTHDTAANAVNLYQFKVSPSGLKRYIIKNM